MQLGGGNEGGSNQTTLDSLKRTISETTRTTGVHGEPSNANSLSDDELSEVVRMNEDYWDGIDATPEEITQLAVDSISTAISRGEVLTTQARGTQVGEPYTNQNGIREYVFSRGDGRTEVIPAGDLASANVDISNPEAVFAYMMDEGLY